MPRKPNYRFERAERDRVKAQKKEERQRAKAERQHEPSESLDETAVDAAQGQSEDAPRGE